MKKVSKQEHEVLLDRERDNLTDAMASYHEVIEKVATQFGIPLETFDSEWDKFVTKLDDSLIETFAVDRDPEDM